MKTSPEQEAAPEIQWQPIDCPFCHGKRSSFFSHEGWQWPTYYVRCKDCGLIYLQPMPRLDPDYLKSLYEKLPEGLERYEMAEDFSLEKLQPIHRQRYEESLDAICAAHPEPGTD